MKHIVHSQTRMILIDTEQRRKLGRHEGKQVKSAIYTIAESSTKYPEQKMFRPNCVQLFSRNILFDDLRLTRWRVTAALLNNAASPQVAYPQSPLTVSDLYSSKPGFSRRYRPQSTVHQATPATLLPDEKQTKFYIFRPAILGYCLRRNPLCQPGTHQQRFC